MLIPAHGSKYFEAFFKLIPLPGSTFNVIQIVKDCWFDVQKIFHSVSKI